MKWLTCLFLGHIENYRHTDAFECIFDVYCSRCGRYLGMIDDLGNKITMKQYLRSLK